MSKITIFGHKHFKQMLHRKFDVFHEKKKNQQPLILIDVLIQDSNLKQNNNKNK